MSIYIKCIFCLIVIFVIAMIGAVIYSLKNKITQQNTFMQKKSSLFIKYNIKNNCVIINNYNYLNLKISKKIMEISKREDFADKIKYLAKNKDEKINYNIEDEGLLYTFYFSYRSKEEDDIIIRCDYNIERIMGKVWLRSLDSLKDKHDEAKNKSAVFYYLNVKDFNSINQRYGQECGDYVLEVLKDRLHKLETKHLYCTYLGSDEFGIYCNKNINKKKALKLIKSIANKLTKTIDVVGVNIEIELGVGMCCGKYDNLQDFINGAYIASEYAGKRKKYNIVIYNEEMKKEGNAITLCENEINNILESKDVNIVYNPVFYYDKIKFIGYISDFSFSNNLVDYEKIKSVAIKEDKINKLMDVLINCQLINYIRKRPSKNAKLFINLKLEDLSNFLEIYLSNPSYSECKIVVCLNVKKGYEMINKFSNISSNISKLLEEGIQLALEIDTGNMYDYDYILKNAKYLILDSGIVKNMNNNFIKNKAMNIVELAKAYNLELLAIDVDEYIQLENMLKYNVHYFSGSYFGKNVKKPGEIEQSKTRIFAKLTKDSKKVKNY